MEKVEMTVEGFILKLDNVTMKSRDLLPKAPGIYYVLDERSIVWYIGKAQNLQSRWQGKAHHRIDQLQKQRQKKFSIYYELVAETSLEALEKQRIEQYNPQLNGTQVKTKTVQTTEQLLRETLILIEPYSFILGVEPPRKHDAKLLDNSKHWRDDWRFQKFILPLNVIHICLNWNELESAFSDWQSAMRFLKKTFRKRANYSSNWTTRLAGKYERVGLFLMRRLLVNGIAIEVYTAQREVAEIIEIYESQKIAGIEMRTVKNTTLVELQKNCTLLLDGIEVKSDKRNGSYLDFCQKILSRLYPYNQDCIPRLFDQ
jgi:predicted GIY-YIG superfamily endonuclease